MRPRRRRRGPLPFLAVRAGGPGGPTRRALQSYHAVPEYRAAIDIDLRNAEARLGLAGALSKTGRPEEAVPEYRAAIDIDLHSAEARLGLADSLAGIGRTEAAVPEYRAAIDIDLRGA